jgi:hypothetical protein
MGYKAMVIILCDNCGKTVRGKVPGWTNGSRRDACSEDCARVIWERLKEAYGNDDGGTA